MICTDTDDNCDVYWYDCELYHITICTTTYIYIHLCIIIYTFMYICIHKQLQAETCLIQRRYGLIINIFLNYKLTNRSVLDIGSTIYYSYNYDKNNYLHKSILLPILSANTAEIIVPGTTASCARKLSMNTCPSL